MAIELTILGSGTSVPHPRRMAPSYLIRSGTTSLLVDCGSGASHSLARRDEGPHTVDTLALTHLHLDHTGDLPSLLFALANPAGPQRQRDLPGVGPVGLRDFMEGLEGAYGRWIHPLQGRLVVRELQDGESIAVGPLTLTAFVVEHSSAPSLAYRISGGGNLLCFSGDTGPCPGLERAAQGVDLLVCECSSLEEAPVEGHMTATDVGRLAAKAGCRRVVLSHLYEHIVTTDPLARVARLYDGPAELAEDGLVFRVE